MKYKPDSEHKPDNEINQLYKKQRYEQPHMDNKDNQISKKYENFLQINQKENEDKEEQSSRIQIASDNQQQLKQYRPVRHQRSVVNIQLEDRSKEKQGSQKRQKENQNSVKQIRYLQNYIEKYEQLYQQNKQLQKQIQSLRLDYEKKITQLSSKNTSDHIIANSNIKIIQIPVQMIINQQQQLYASKINNFKGSQLLNSESDFLNQVKDILNQKSVPEAKLQKQDKKQNMQSDMFLTPFLQQDKYGDISEIHQADSILQNNSSLSNAQNIVRQMHNNKGNSSDGLGNAIFQYSNDQNNSVAVYRNERLMQQIQNNSLQFRRNFDSSFTRKNSQNYFQLKKQNQEFHQNILSLRAQLLELKQKIEEQNRQKQHTSNEIQSLRQSSLEKQQIKTELNLIIDQIKSKQEALGTMTQKNITLLKQIKKFQKKESSFESRQHILNKQIQQLKSQCQSYEKMIETLQQRHAIQLQIYIERIQEKNIQCEFITQQYRKLQTVLIEEISKNKNMIFLVDKLEQENMQFQKIVKRFNQTYASQQENLSSVQKNYQDKQIKFMYNQALLIKRTIQQKQKLYEDKIQKLVLQMQNICDNFQKQQKQYKLKIERLQKQLNQKLSRNNGKYQAINISKTIENEKAQSSSQRSEIQMIYNFLQKQPNKIKEIRQKQKGQSMTQNSEVSQSQIHKFNQQKNQLIRSLQKIIEQNKVQVSEQQEIQPYKRDKILVVGQNIELEKNERLKNYQKNHQFNLDVQVQMNVYITTLLNKIQHLQKLLLRERQQKIKTSKTLRLLDQKIKREQLFSGMEKTFSKQICDMDLINELTIEIKSLRRINNILIKENQRMKKVMSKQFSESQRLDENIFQKKVSNEEIILMEKYDKVKIEANQLRLENIGLRNKIKQLQKSSITQSNHGPLKKKQSNLQKKPKYLSVQEFNVLNEEIINNFQMMKHQYEKQINELNEELDEIRGSSHNKTQPVLANLAQKEENLGVKINEDAHDHDNMFKKKRSKSLEQQSLQKNDLIQQSKINIHPQFQQHEPKQIEESQEERIILTQNLFPFYKNQNYKYDQIFVGNINTLSLIIKRKNTERVKYVLTQKILQLAINALTNKQQGKAILNSMRPQKILVFYFKEDDPHSIILKYNPQLTDNSESQNSSDKNRTLIYLPPQMLLGSFQQQQSYSWTIGLIIDEIFHGRFFYRRFDQILSHKNNYMFENRSNHQLAQTVQKLMRKNYRERISLYQALVEVNLLIVQRHY